MVNLPSPIYIHKTARQQAQYMQNPAGAMCSAPVVILLGNPVIWKTLLILYSYHKNLFDIEKF